MSNISSGEDTVQTAHPSSVSPRGSRHQVTSVLVGESPSISNVRQTILRVAPTDMPVLICGETGTGKETVARMLHERSARRDRPFIVVRCAALSQDDIEAELFGSRSNSVEGGAESTGGIVHAAAGGTLFLDEISDLSFEMQAKLNCLLENGKVPRRGEIDAPYEHVRVVSATNRQAREAVADGTLRQDVYFRLAAVLIELPPLRDMIDDLPRIAQYLLDHLYVPGSLARRLSPAALEIAQQYHWPGNVRELRNALERGMIFSEGEEIQPDDLDLPQLSSWPSTDGDDRQVMRLADAEQQLIQGALCLHGGNKTAAARTLGVSLRTLYNKLDARMKIAE